MSSRSTLTDPVRSFSRPFKARRGPACGIEEEKMLKVGDKAPGFAVSAHTGAEVKLSDYAGRKVILWFYPVADTPG